MTDSPQAAYLETERKVINLMLRHHEVVGEMIDQRISPDFFDQRHRPLVQAIYYIFSVSEGKRLLTENHYRDMLLEQGGKGDFTIAMQTYSDCLYGVHYTNTKDDFDLLKKKLVESFVHRRGVEALQSFNENRHKLGYVEATRQFRDELSAAIDFTQIKKSNFMTIDSLKEAYLSRLEERMADEEKILQCKIPEINEAMNVGFKAGHTTLIIAATGCHKTNMMLNIALQLFSNGANVLFLPLEMDWEDFMNRVIANIADISYKALLNPRNLLSDEELKRVRECKIWMEQNNRFALLDVDERISISVLQREIEKRANYFAPRVLVVDYIGLLKVERKFAGRHDLALGELTKSLKFMGKKYGFHVITAAQLGRADIRRLRQEGSDASLDSTAVKDSQEVSSDAEFIFALTTVPDENDRLKIHVIKSRYGPSGYTKELQLQADKCKISSTEIIISSDLQADAIDDDFMNEPAEQAAENYQKIKESMPEFKSMSPDDLDDLDTW